MRVAEEYGTRIDGKNLKNNGLSRLIRGYPTHGFIIDHKEAMTIFHSVRYPSDQEWAVLFRYAAESTEHSEPASIVDIAKEFFDVAQNQQEDSETPPEQSGQSETKTTETSTE